jgi:hypothetical protein
MLGIGSVTPRAERIELVPGFQAIGQINSAAWFGEHVLFGGVEPDPLPFNLFHQLLQCFHIFRAGLLRYILGRHSSSK